MILLKVGHFVGHHTGFGFQVIKEAKIQCLVDDDTMVTGLGKGIGRTRRGTRHLQCPNEEMILLAHIW